MAATRTLSQYIVVDTGIAHEIDARELPPGWQDGYFGVMTDSPTAVPRLEYRTEVYRLDDNLLQQAMALDGLMPQRLRVDGGEARGLAGEELLRHSAIGSVVLAHPAT